MVSNSHKFFLGKNGMGLASLMKRLGRYGPGVVAVVCVECFFDGYRAKPLTVLCRHAPKGRPPHPPPRSPPPRIPRPGGLPWTAHRYWPGIIGPTWSFAMGRRFRDPSQQRQSHHLTTLRFLDRMNQSYGRSLSLFIPKMAMVERKRTETRK